MSVWSRLLEFVSGTSQPPSGPPPNAPRDGAGAVAEPASRPSAAEAENPLIELAALRKAAGGDADIDERALVLLARALLLGREETVLDAARTLLVGRVLPGLRLRLADRLITRGDVESAAALLEPIVPPASDAGSLEAWALAAEVAERRGDPERARTLYERVLSRDYSHPRARERAQRLRDAHSKPRKLDGATLLGEGATSRRFRILAELGRGGAGTVFLAEEPALARSVALKIYHRRGRLERERLLHEARTAASLEHPGIVRVLDLDETLGALVMEPLEEGSVKTRLGRGDAPYELRRAWARSAADALWFVHARGIVHGDVKPSNFLLRGERSAVLTDFGIARRVGELPGDAGEGSLGYMPPEQQAGAPASFAADVHALGVSLGEIFRDDAPDALAALTTACRRAEPQSRPTLDELRRELD